MTIPLIYELLSPEIQKRISQDIDYDWRTYLKEKPQEALRALTSDGHAPDTYKLPNHPTFSTDSKYSTPEHEGGRWLQGGQELWEYFPSEWVLKQHSQEELQEYFKKNDPDALLHIETLSKKLMPNSNKQVKE